MIGQLKGIIDLIADDHVILEASGVGYIVFCSERLLKKLEKGQTTKILIDTHVREDHIHLYGFTNSEEKIAFQILQSVKGVGTRMSMAILSKLSPPEIQYALLRKDHTTFISVSGVGKKLAERIITELKDRNISTSDMTEMNIKSPIVSKEDQISNDAIAALIALGINKNDAANRIHMLINKNKNMTINELVKIALQNGSLN